MTIELVSIDKLGSFQNDASNVTMSDPRHLTRVR